MKKGAKLYMYAGIQAISGAPKGEGGFGGRTPPFKNSKSKIILLI